MLEIEKRIVPESKYGIKCPHEMIPIGITIHNTANDAPAYNEIAYMTNNNKLTSFHFAVDDCHIVQGIELNRNSWNAGDGNGNGNRKTISIEICYSKSGGERWFKAVDNAAQLVAKLMKDYGFGYNCIYKHQDWSGKHCPHRILDEYGWDNFINRIDNYYAEKSVPDPVPVAPSKKSIDEIAKEVLNGKWGNGVDRKIALREAGYDYNEVQNAVNALCGAKSSVSKSVAPTKKSNEDIAREVIAGKWGNGLTRRTRLKNAGYNYSVIQKIVNQLCKR